MAGHGADLLQHSALLADDDALVACLLAEDGGIHIDHAGITFGELGDLDGGAVGNFLIQAQQQLLTQQLAHDQTLRLIGGHAVGEQLGAFGCILAQLGHQLLQTVLAVGRDGNDGIKAVPHFVISSNDGQQLGGLHGVDLVDAENGGNALFLHTLDQSQFGSAHMGNGLHQQQCAVHITQTGGDNLHHVLTQRRLGLVQTRSIHQDILGVVTVHNAVDPVAGGLCLVGHDGDLLAHQCVGQAGLAHVGAAANSDHCYIFDFRHKVILNFLVFEHFYCQPVFRQIKRLFFQCFL